MNIYLTHPIHGAKVATMELEAEMDEQNGWTRYNPDTPSAPEEAVPANALGMKRKYTRRIPQPAEQIEGATEGV